MRITANRGTCSEADDAHGSDASRDLRVGRAMTRELRRALLPGLPPVPTFALISAGVTWIRGPGESFP